MWVNDFENETKCKHKVQSPLNGHTFYIYTNVKSPLWFYVTRAGIYVSKYVSTVKSKPQNCGLVSQEVSGHQPRTFDQSSLGSCLQGAVPEHALPSVNGALEVRSHVGRPPARLSPSNEALSASRCPDSPDQLARHSSHRRWRPRSRYRPYNLAADASVQTPYSHLFSRNDTYQQPVAKPP